MSNSEPDWIPPEDYTNDSENFTSGYGSTLINTVPHEEEQLLHDEEDEDSEELQNPPPPENLESQRVES